MIVEFYQVPIIMLNNSSYLGNLAVVEDKEVNVNLKDLRNIDLFLPKEFVKYNYIKITDDNQNFYYMLDNYRYDSGNNVRLYYKIDVLRTIKDFNNLEYNVRLNRYSGLLDFTEEENNYFWDNQPNKLGTNIISKYYNLRNNKSESFSGTGESVLSEMTWVYMWIQPKAEIVEGNIPYNYKLTRGFRDEDLVTGNDNEFPEVGQEYFIARTSSEIKFFGHKFFDNYPTGTVFYNTDEDLYYISRSRKNSWFERYFLGVFVDYAWVEVITKPLAFETYSLSNLRMIEDNMTLPLYTLVFPMDTIGVQNDVDMAYTDKHLRWGIDEILPYISDPEVENTWVDNVVDIKISNVAPFDISKVLRRTINNNYVILKGSLSNHEYGEIPNLYNRVRKFGGNSLDIANEIDNDLYIPMVIEKPSGLTQLDSDFDLEHLPIDKENMIENKFYLSLLESRIELDISNLKENKAYELYFYEDVSPGRSNLLVGYVPGDLEDSDKIRYLIHSPSTLSIDRDLSAPLFTAAYNQYLANNKNFIAQAELSRKTQLTQGLVNSGSQALGATSAAISMPGYNPSNAITRAAGGAINSIISYQAQEKQFRWQLDNIKNASGSYKSASATLNTIMNLHQIKPFISKYTSNTFDKKLYNQLVKEMGYEYFDYKFRLDKILNNLNNVYSEDVAYIQGRFTNANQASTDMKLTILLRILNERLQEGIKVYRS